MTTENTTKSKGKDAEILENVIHALKHTKNSFAYSGLKYKNHMSVYNVVDGNGNLTDNMKLRIKTYFPQVNPRYLDHGELPILKEGDFTKSALSPLNGEEKRFTIRDLEHVPDQLNRIEEMLKELTGRQ